MEMTLACLGEEDTLTQDEIAWRQKDWEAVEKLANQYKETPENELFGLLNDITANKVQANLASKSSYSKFWIDNALSQHVDCMDAVYTMNLVGSKLSDQDHFNYYLHSIRQGKRFGKWAKLVEDPEEQVVLSLIAKKWSLNMYDAIMYRDTLVAKDKLQSVLKLLKPVATKEFVATVVKLKADQTKVIKAIAKW